MLKSLADVTEDNFKIFHTVIGRVINIDDPLKQDRIQCRILGITSDEVSDANCPWCEQKGVIFSGTDEISGISTVPEIDSYVYIEFLYGNVEAPLYTGYVRGGKDSSLVHNLESTHSSVQARKDNVIGPEPSELTSSSQYPYNNVIETRTGNIIELDDTESNERITITHKSGSYFEIRPDGSVVTKCANGTFYSLVKGDLETFITGNSNEIIEGDETQAISGKSSKDVSSSYTVTASTINLN